MVGIESFVGVVGIFGVICNVEEIMGVSNSLDVVGFMIVLEI